jgi:hypothetical protein
MLRNLLILVIGLTVFLNAKKSPAESFDIRFGILVDGVVVEETTVIPFYPVDTGFRYGFTISHDSYETYTSYAVHYLPEKPISAGGSFEKSDKIRPARRLKTKEEEIFDKHTFVEHGFEKGDPLGLYKLDIYINGRVAKSITYKVVTPEEYKRRKN